MTRHDIDGLVFWGVIAILYGLRNQHPFFKQLWKFISLFLLILLATLTVNYAKDRFKEWWKS